MAFGEVGFDRGSLAMVAVGDQDPPPRPPARYVPPASMSDGCRLDSYTPLDHATRYEADEKTLEGVSMLCLRPSISEGQ